MDYRFYHSHTSCTDYNSILYSKYVCINPDWTVYRLIFRYIKHINQLLFLYIAPITATVTSRHCAVMLDQEEPNFQTVPTKSGEWRQRIVIDSREHVSAALYSTAVNVCSKMKKLASNSLCLFPVPHTVQSKQLFWKSNFLKMLTFVKPQNKSKQERTKAQAWLLIAECPCYYIKCIISFVVTVEPNAFFKKNICCFFVFISAAAFNRFIANRQSISWRTSSVGLNMKKTDGFLFIWILYLCVHATIHLSLRTGTGQKKTIFPGSELCVFNVSKCVFSASVTHMYLCCFYA